MHPWAIRGGDRMAYRALPYRTDRRDRSIYFFFFSVHYSSSYVGVVRLDD